MKKLLTSAVVLSVLALTGCHASNTGGGGPAGGTFKLKGPTGVTATTVKHGGTKDVEITLDKGKDFKEAVTLTAEVEPKDKGVTAEVAPKTVKAGDPNKATVKVTAKETAADGDYTVTVTGKPDKGESSTLALKFKVPKKE
jgi:uncharacterized membrane protein